jgi:hypothetical protein
MRGPDKLLAVFEQALLYSIASQASRRFVEETTNSVVALLIVLMLTTVACLYIGNRLETVSTNVSDTASGANLIRTLTALLAFVLGVVTNTIVQLQSTLCAHFAMKILDSALGTHWILTTSVVSLALIWILAYRLNIPI